MINQQLKSLLYAVTLSFIHNLAWKSDIEPQVILQNNENLYILIANYTGFSKKKKLKERFENASDLNGEKKIRILMWTVLGMKSSHIIWRQ